jgi:hypothetical protein
MMAFMPVYKSDYDHIDFKTYNFSSLLNLAVPLGNSAHLIIFLI